MLKTDSLKMTYLSYLDKVDSYRDGLISTYRLLVFPHPSIKEWVEGESLAAVRFGTFENISISSAY